jgi:hypothetical protein
MAPQHVSTNSVLMCIEDRIAAGAFDHGVAYPPFLHSLSKSRWAVTEAAQVERILITFVDEAVFSVEAWSLASSVRLTLRC